jgi:DNA-binding transcriptional MerR regulator
VDKIEPELSAFAPLTIGAVERDTGLSKDTLRVWERRYGFPTPERDSTGERVYSLAQVEKLRLIKRLLDQGLRPSKLIAASAEELGSMITARRGTPGAVVAPTALADMAELVQLHRNEELRAALSQMLLKLGLQRFVIECVAALNVAIGEAWMRGAIGVHEEHLYTEQIQNLLRAAISAQHAAGRRPKVLSPPFRGKSMPWGC